MTASRLLICSLLLLGQHSGGLGAAAADPDVPMSVLQSAYIKPINPGAGDFFSRPNADGNRLVVGSSFEGSDATGVNGDPFNDAAPGSGAAYLFERGVAGTWAQVAYLKSSNSDVGDRFGFSVAVSGDTIVVGAPFEASNATGVNGNQEDNSLNSAGAAYVFVRNGAGNWVQQAYLKASNTERNDLFGSTVAIDGDTIAVAANGEDSGSPGVNGNQADNSVMASGAVYVFERDDSGQWSQSAYIKSSNPGFVDAFGRSISIDDDTLAVGADGEASDANGVGGNQLDDSAPSAGAAYIYRRDPVLIWSQQAYLKSSHSDAEDHFGGSLELSGDRLIVGAVGEDAAVGAGPDNNDAADTGAAFVFERGAGGWSQSAYLKAANGDPGDAFGVVSIRGGLAIVGATGESSASTVPNQGEDDNSAPQSGAAYVFTRTADASWLQQAYLKAANAESEDRFGLPSLSDEGVIVGAFGEDSSSPGDPSDNGAPTAGAAYAFDLGSYSVSGAVAGLVDGNRISLRINGAEVIVLDRDGSFRFDTEFAPGSAYSVNVFAQSLQPGQICQVINGEGELGLADVTDVLVQCAPGLGGPQSIDTISHSATLLLILLLGGFGLLAMASGRPLR